MKALCKYKEFIKKNVLLKCLEIRFWEIKNIKTMMNEVELLIREDLLTHVVLHILSLEIYYNTRQAFPNPFI